jgi:hypothetical protein
MKGLSLAIEASVAEHFTGDDRDVFVQAVNRFGKLQIA